MVRIEDLGVGVRGSGDREGVRLAVETWSGVEESRAGKGGQESLDVSLGLMIELCASPWRTLRNGKQGEWLVVDPL